MKRGCRFTRQDLERDPKLKALVEAALDRDSTAKQERDGHLTLGGSGQSQKGMVHIDCPLLVRITRVIPPRGRRYDDDNMQGGCKQLRDSIAACLGLQGDSEEDGIAFEYAQTKGQEAETIIEIWSKQ